GCLWHVLGSLVLLVLLLVGILVLALVGEQILARDLLLAEALEISESGLALPDGVLHLRRELFRRLWLQELPRAGALATPGLVADEDRLDRDGVLHGAQGLVHAVGQHVVDRHVDEAILAQHHALHAKAARLALALE